MDLWLFYDCILDEHFKVLKAHIALPESEPSTLLIPTIAKQAPRLEELELNFYWMKSCDENKLAAVIKSLASLQHLSSLHLSEVSSSARLPLMGLIGKSCPTLSSLTITGGGTFSNEAILALVTGESAIGRLPNGEPSSWCTDETILHLEIPLEDRSPICSTLQKLILVPTQLKQGDDIVSPSALSFALRHFPLAQSVGSYSTSEAILLLSKTKKLKSWNEYKKACRPANLNATLSHGNIDLNSFLLLLIAYLKKNYFLQASCPSLK